MLKIAALESTLMFYPILLLGFIFVLFYLKKINNAYRFFEKRNIKFPPCTFFFGNYFEIRKDNKFTEVLQNWTKIYGKTYGYFDGHTPILVTSDLDLIQNIFVKQYDKFSARKLRATDRPDNASKVNLVNAIGKRWKNIRNIMNPAFSNSRLKTQISVFNTCTSRFVGVMNKKIDKEINIKDMLKRFTIDCIWNCTLGIDINLQENNKDDCMYFKMTEDALFSFVHLKFPLQFTVLLSEFRYFIIYAYLLKNSIHYKFNEYFGVKYVDALYWLRERTLSLISEKSHQKIANKNDLLQLLLEAHTDDTSECQKINNEKLSKKLSIDEIKMNLSAIILGGSDTTSTVLIYSFYILANMPEEQDKLICEVDKYFPHTSMDEPDYVSLKQLEYMQFFFYEILRMNPLVNEGLTRRCIEATNVNGIDVPKDLTIQIDVLSVHYNQELWGPVDVETFYPLRFTEKRHKLGFLGFGAGPRQCIGKDFAITQIKIFLVNFLRHFRVAATGKTKSERLNFVEGFSRIITDDLFLCIKERH